MMNKTGPSARPLAGVLLAIVGMLVALLMAELGARLLPPPYEYSPSYRCDRWAGWLGMPGLSIVETTDDFTHDVVRNSQGMHDREHTFAKPDGVFRILLLGDSFADAREVDEARANHRVMEDRLNAKAPDGVIFEVIVGGIRGWGPAQELLYLQRYGYRYDPDLVLGFWLPRNDLEDVLPDYRRTQAGINCYAPYFAVCDGVFDPQAWFSAPGVAPTLRRCSPAKKTVTNVLNWIYHRSSLYQHLEPLTVAWFTREEIEPWYLPWVDPELAGESLAYAYQVTAGIYSEMAKSARGMGAEAAFVVLPTRETIQFEVDAEFREKLLSVPGLSDGDILRPNRAFRELAAPTGVPVLDLEGALADYARTTGESLYWVEDGHWNVAGNRVAGEAMADWLMETGLVPARR